MQIYSLDQVEEAAALLKNHGILAFPTDTVYGVGVLYGDLTDLSRLKAAKKRPEKKPIPLMAASIEQLEQAAVFNETARKLADALLPGAITLVLPLKEGVDRAWTNGKDTIAVRIPDSKFVIDLISRLPAPLMVSSANLSGEPAALSKEDVLEHLPGIDGVVDGACTEGIASTIIDCTTETPRILRAGPVSEEEIIKITESSH